MGMHEIEALVAESIKFLDKVEGVDHRSLFKSLYDFEGKFDTGFTRFRVMDTLLKRHFTYRVPLEDHPQYEQCRNELEALRNKDFAHIYRNPSLKWSSTDNPSVCYWKSPHLYFEAGSEIWKQMIDAGRLAGVDAIKPVDVDPIDIAFILLKPTSAGGEYGLELLSWWYFAIPIAMAWGVTTRQEATAREDPTLQAIRDGVIRSEAYRITSSLSEGASCEDAFSAASPTQLAFMKWWFPPSLVPATTAD
jgi:hypothetical protein